MKSIDGIKYSGIFIPAYLFYKEIKLPEGNLNLTNLFILDDDESSENMTLNIDLSQNKYLAFYHYIRQDSYRFFDCEKYFGSEGCHRLSLVKSTASYSDRTPIIYQKKKKDFTRKKCLCNKKLALEDVNTIYFMLTQDEKGKLKWPESTDNPVEQMVNSVIDSSKLVYVCPHCKRLYRYPNGSESTPSMYEMNDKESEAKLE